MSGQSEPSDEPGSGRASERLVVALVRGVHGLRGAVRVEVLTDHPETRFAKGRVLHREGDDRPLTIASAEAVADGPGWRVRFDEVTTRETADTLRGGGITRSITVRRIASGVGVERTFKINSPRIEKIEVIRHGVARRAQLYFLRDRVGKAATLRERRQG